jgi:hypothetical protein
LLFLLLQRYPISKRWKINSSARKPTYVEWIAWDFAHAALQLFSSAAVQFAREPFAIQLHAPIHLLAASHMPTSAMTTHFAALIHAM